ncbi:amino acid ABC transporter substrate-binding protein, partial [Streptococcus pneumoniae]
MKSIKWIFVLCNFLASFFLVACQSGSDGSQSAVEAIKQKGRLVVAIIPD